MLASAASLILFSAGCSEVREVPVTDLRPFKPISSSCQDTEQTRKEIRAHNSVYETLKSGKRIVFTDPCKDQSKPTS